MAAIGRRALPPACLVAAPGTGHDGHGHDGHGHEADQLGPTDWTMWSIGLLGVIAALVVAAGFAMATGFNFGL